MTRESGFALVESDDVIPETVDEAPGLEKAVLIDESHGAPRFALRRFTLLAGGAVPRHTNELEHVQYALDGGYVLGVGEEEHRIEAGDAMYIPAGAVHWYRNPTDDPVHFLCTVPHGDDAIRLVEE
jgi:quercetin dioxygenase-like cupin family protein